MKSLLDFLSSMRLAVILFTVIAAASLAGTFMKQEYANDIIYGSFWFMLLLFALFLNTSACLLKKKFSAATAGSYLMHLGIPVIMAGAIAGNIAGFSGFVMIGEGGTAGAVQVNGKEKALPFRLELERFEIDRAPVIARHFIVSYFADGHDLEKAEFKGENETLVLHGRKITIRKILPDFVMGADMKPVTRSKNWENPAVRIEAGGKEMWLFSMYPDYHGGADDGTYNYEYECGIKGGEIRQYTSRIRVFTGGEKFEKAVVSVNKPFKYMGHTIYQASYDEKTLKASGFIIKKDPGVAFVYAGFVLLCLGMCIQVFRKLSNTVT